MGRGRLLTISLITPVAVVDKVLQTAAEWFIRSAEWFIYEATTLSNRDNMSSPMSALRNPCTGLALCCVRPLVLGPAACSEAIDFRHEQCSVTGRGGAFLLNTVLVVPLH
jgi:hypothetical protein